MKINTYKFVKINFLARDLMIFCENEIENIEGCAECYENRQTHPYEWRVMACSKPHLLLRTKRSNGYVPVKLISIVNDKKIKVVRFDGNGADFVNILAQNCYVYHDFNNKKELEVRNNLSKMKMGMFKSFCFGSDVGSEDIHHEYGVKVWYISFGFGSKAISYETSR